MSLAFRPEYDVRVVCLDRPGQWAGDLRAQGVPVHGVARQPGFDPAVAWRMAGLFRAWGVRLIHAHQCTPWFYAALSRLRYPAPKLLLEEHGRFWPEVSNARRAWLHRHVIRRLTHRFVAVSADVRARLVAYEGLRTRDIAVVPNGVQSEPVLPPSERVALRAGLGFGPQDFVVGTVGRFDPIKNLPLLVDALAALIDRPDPGGHDRRIAALLVGDGPERAAIETRVRALGLSERVRFTGFRQDARRLVQAMDLFVLGSFSEGTSMALLEALGAGIPVVVTAVGGNVEVVAAHETGWVVPTDDRVALTAAIADAASNEVRRRQYAAAGRRRFAERYTFAGMIDTYRGLYREMLGR